jgi:spore germination protein YaaH
LAKEKKVKVVPTVLWLHGNAIHQTLSSTSTRKAHVEDILSMVDRNGFDGIDIDYENKIVDTRYYFSRFLRELSEGLHLKKKLLVCTIEPRTPVSSLFKVPPKSVERANDYVFINKYCDSVRLMTYDQATADLLLNKSKGDGVFYAPVADSDWVKKVIGETTKTISKKKIMLGVATYGYEYKVDTTDRDNPVYTRLRVIGNDAALQLASSTNSKVFTNVSGEKSFAYTDKGQIHFITWSDANAIQAKVKISKQYGLKGVAIFKIDGEGDKNMWSVLR